MSVPVTPGVWAWAGLVLGVLVYDSWALLKGRETMTAAFGRGLAHRGARWPVAAVWGATTLHLFNRLPRQIDPFHGYSSVMRRFVPR